MLPPPYEERKEGLHQAELAPEQRQQGSTGSTGATGMFAAHVEGAGSEDTLPGLTRTIGNTAIAAREASGSRYSRRMGPLVRGPKPRGASAVHPAPSYSDALLE